jgi:hypothetical protein
METNMRTLASRCLAAVVPALLAASACSDTSDARIAPTDPLYGKSGKPANGTSQGSMSISPTSVTIAAGEATTLSVTYRDKQGNVIPDSNMRLTYYGCYPVAPAGATCNDLLTITPVMPYLRQAVIQGLAAGQARLYASDGLGTYVYADLVIK